MGTDLHRLTTDKKTILIKGQLDERIQALVKEAIEEDKTSKEYEDNGLLFGDISEEQMEEIIADFKSFLVKQHFVDEHGLTREEACAVVDSLEPWRYDLFAEAEWRRALQEYE
jgi:hypothetical protein